MGEKQKYDQTLISRIFDEYIAAKKIDAGDEYHYEFHLGVDEDAPQPLMSPCCDASLAKHKICDRDRYEMKNEWAYTNEENWVRY